MTNRHLVELVADQLLEVEAEVLGPEVGVDHHVSQLLAHVRRGDAGVTAADVGKELADVVIYADLWAQHLGLDLEELIRNKFNEVSVRHGAPERL